jgi:hypothetical protein
VPVDLMYQVDRFSTALMEIVTDEESLRLPTH